MLCLLQGELWKAQSRLVYEWSMAGYQQGNAPIPNLPVTVNLKTTYGAVGDGIADDTAALTTALNAINKGVIYLPAGRGWGHLTWTYWRMD